MNGNVRDVTRSTAWAWTILRPSCQATAETLRSLIGY